MTHCLFLQPLGQRIASVMSYEAIGWFRVLSASPFTAACLPIFIVQSSIFWLLLMSFVLKQQISCMSFNFMSNQCVLYAINFKCLCYPMLPRWYHVNYDNADQYLWGRNMGCDFVMRSCLDWIETRENQLVGIRLLKLSLNFTSHFLPRKVIPTCFWVHFTLQPPSVNV